MRFGIIFYCVFFLYFYLVRINTFSVGIKWKYDDEYDSDDSDYDDIEDNTWVCFPGFFG